MIEGQLERGLVLGPLSLFLQELDLLIVRELHVAEHRRQIALRCIVLLAGQILCLGCNIVKIECPQLARAHQADQCGTGHQGLAQPIAGDSRCFMGTNNHEQPSPKTDHETNGQRQMPGWRALFGPREGVMIPQTDPDNARVRVKRTCERRSMQRAIIQQVA
ncbi:hypothetical protein D3C75_965480 [compost metagenome]